MASRVFKQLQFVGFGAATSYYLDTFSHLNHILTNNSVYSVPWLSTSLALVCAVITAVGFLYVLVYLPRFKGVRVDYEKWRETELKWAVPVLTASIMTGWHAFLYVLWRYSSLSFIWSAVADLGIYTLSFGILGLIPHPPLPRARPKTS
ncbi:hypothetical protein DL93DRAFT_2071291 [Clavulina sp. PMI_390]|nr:hypothetical protein DL93DRAFT_2071291 [Clavulina sp. PMI_390]